MCGITYSGSASFPITNKERSFTVELTLPESVSDKTFLKKTKKIKRLVESLGWTIKDLEFYINEK